MRVLAALAAGAGAQALSAIGARAGVSPSQTHRYLQSLLAAGMAVQDASGRYDLGPAAISVGIAALSRLDSFARAESALRSFTAETGRTSLLSVWGEAGAVVVRWFPGTPPIYSSVTLGSILPLLHSASGHVFLAFLPEQVTAAVLLYERAHDHAVLPLNVANIRAEVRNRLLSDAAPAMLSGLRAMAAPVFDLQGNLALVATAIATDAFDIAEDDAVAQRLQAACRAATEAVGGGWPQPQSR
jgi:DNA-binding IclR family transcriptional regulator